VWLTLTERGEVRLGEDTETNSQDACATRNYFGEGAETNSPGQVLPGRIHEDL